MRTRSGAGHGKGSGERAEPAGRRLLRTVGRLLGLLVVVLLVVAIGVGVRAPGTVPPTYSATQRAQLEAENRYRSLAGAARDAAAATPPADPPIVELLLAAAADLEVQADAVALPRSPERTPAPTGPSGPAGEPSAVGTPNPDPTGTAQSSDAPQVLGQLRDSALASLADAVDADPGPARVLAAAGANQWQRALALGAALGVDPGLPAAGPTTTAELAAGAGPFAGAGTGTGAGTGGDAGSGSAAPAPSTADSTEDSSPSAPGAVDGTARGEECAGTPLGSDADRQALRTARTAEDRARYGYEVAAALVEDRAVLLERAATHGRAAAVAADRLAALCDTPDPTAAGFALPPGFREDPLGELLRLEQQHVDLHAGQVAMTTGPDTRAWAAMALTAAVVRSVDTGAALQPLPGIAGTPRPPVDGSPTTSGPVPGPAGDAATPEEPSRG